MPSRRHEIPAPLNDVEAAYTAAMRAEAMSPETMRQRLYLLRGLGADPRQAGHQDVIRLLTERDLSQHSRASYISVLKTIFRDLVRLGLVDADPTARLKTPRTPRRLPRPLPPGELAALEAMRPDRERAWTILGAYAGLRASDVVSLTGTALQDGINGPVLHLVGKGGVEANIPAHRKVIAVLEPYVGQPGPIWPMWPSSLDRAWSRAADDVGVHGRVFHQLRHTYATRLTQAGVPLLVVAEVCRHASVATTQRYAQVASDAGQAAIALL